MAFKSALADIASVAHTLAARKNTLDAGIASAAKTFENGARVTAQLGPVIERVGRSADAIEKLGQDASQASTNAGKAVTEIGADVQRFTAETLPEVQRLLGELNVLSVSLRRLSEQTERDPSSLLRGRSPVPDGPGESPAKARR
jgi:phospholipid/cholesterol/gamma-HCH transport system substrate-binding protein